MADDMPFRIEQWNARERRLVAIRDSLVVARAAFTAAAAEYEARLTDPSEQASLGHHQYCLIA
jgi:hypothetical protein